MELARAIEGTVEAYAALVQFNALVEGADRALICGAATAGMRNERDEKLAWQIADFLPLALARPPLLAQGVQLDSHYARIDSRGRLRVYRPLADEPVFVAAVELAPTLRAQQPQVSERLAQASVEYQQVQAALAAGSLAKNLSAGPPVLNGPDELCPPLNEQPRFDEEPWWLTQLKRQQRPWWKFW